ncbi:MAG: DUF2177 family protein [Candidatus Pacebacteria bacterium]|nr:DUF2177 family protein [Candidatus Paceibacterota bacterium]
MFNLIKSKKKVNFLKVYLVSLIGFLIIDALWLLVIASDFYAFYLAGFIGDEINWFPATVFYLLFPLALSYFVIYPALVKESKKLAIKAGAFLGLTAYMTYELTNFTLLELWPWQVVVVDILWGALISALVSYLTYKLLK